MRQIENPLPRASWWPSPQRRAPPERGFDGVKEIHDAAFGSIEVGARHAEE
jgi:hypothetical protein